MHALVRELSPDGLEACELTHLERQPIDASRALQEHAAYVDTLRSLGVEVSVLPALPGHPDGVFVEDCAVVLDEVAVVTRPGAPSRRGETASVAAALAEHRPCVAIEDPATLEGGDVVVCGEVIYVGWSSRTNHAGLKSLAHLLLEHGYLVKAVEVSGCLHLKSAMTRLDDERLLANTDFVGLERVRGMQVVDVHPDEPWGANVLAVGETLLCSAAYPRTNERLQSMGYAVEVLDLEELHKMESGVTCSSILFR